MEAKATKGNRDLETHVDSQTHGQKKYTTKLRGEYNKVVVVLDTLMPSKYYALLFDNKRGIVVMMMVFD